MIRTTKKALISSILVLAMCFSALIGTTFAWFTDSVSSTGNVIQTGTLDVEFWMYNASAGEYADISEETKPIYGAGGLIDQWEDVDMLWEPGKTQIVYLAVKNAGSLALKYNILVDVVDLGLVGALDYAIIDGAEYGDVSAANWAAITNTSGVQTGLLAAGRTVAAQNGAIVEKNGTDYFALAIHMDENAGNDYQDKSVVIDINIVATQLSSEKDSFDNQYDADASFGSYTASEPVDENAARVEVEVRNDAGYKEASVSAPKAALAEGVKELTVNIKADSAHPNVTVAANEEVKGFDVTVLGLKENNTEPVRVELRIPAGLDPATVKLYHYDNPISCTYTPSTGYVIFETATFSPFTVVYDAESEYEAPSTEGLAAPKAIVEYAPDWVNNATIEWGGYDTWYPTPGKSTLLDAAFTFSCPELEGDVYEAYKLWLCDFYVSLDRDLGANEIFLGGNYAGMTVGFHNGNNALAANTELPLLGTALGNGESNWTYEMIASLVQNFVCGVGDATEDNKLDGATFTVHLRLTNPETGEKINVNTVTYTFGSYPVIDGEAVANTAQDIQDAIENGEEYISLGGDIDLSDLMGGN